MASIWEKAISILTGNLNSSRIYHITAVLHTSVHFLDTFICLFKFFEFNISHTCIDPTFLFVHWKIAIDNVAKIAENFHNMIFSHISGQFCNTDFFRYRWRFSGLPSWRWASWGTPTGTPGCSPTASTITWPGPTSSWIWSGSTKKSIVLDLWSNNLWNL